MIHIYYGLGKGKTCSAVGQVMRMVGHGKTAAFLQFLKDGTSGEVNSLVDEKVEYYRPTQFDSLESNERFFSYLMMNLTNYRYYDIIVLDEVLDAIIGGAGTEKQLVEFMDSCNKKGIELVITGHYLPEPAILQRADYLTHFEKQKHPYDRGIGAREGVEY